MHITNQSKLVRNGTGFYILSRDAPVYEFEQEVIIPTYDDVHNDNFVPVYDDKEVCEVNKMEEKINKLMNDMEFAKILLDERKKEIEVLKVRAKGQEEFMIELSDRVLKLEKDSEEETSELVDKKTKEEEIPKIKVSGYSKSETLFKIVKLIKEIENAKQKAKNIDSENILESIKEMAEIKVKVEELGKEISERRSGLKNYKTDEDIKELAKIIKNSLFGKTSNSNNTYGSLLFSIEESMKKFEQESDKLPDSIEELMKEITNCKSNEEVKSLLNKYKAIIVKLQK